MGIYTQSQQLKFFFDPSRRLGLTLVKSWSWGGLATVDLLTKDPARLIKFSSFCFLSDFDSIVGSQTLENFTAFTWKCEGRWRTPTREYIRLNTCDFNCPQNFASLSVNTQENWFMTNDYPIYQRECFYMGGFSLERLEVGFMEAVDITPVPNPPFADRRLYVDFRFTIEYEV